MIFSLQLQRTSLPQSPVYSKLRLSGAMWLRTRGHHFELPTIKCVLYVWVQQTKQ